MNTTSMTYEELVRENAALRERLEEAEALTQAISEDRVDAFVIARDSDPRVLVLEGCDLPYRQLVDSMQQGAMSLSKDGVIAYVNRSLSLMVGTDASDLVGQSLVDLVAVQLRPIVEKVLAEGREKGAEGEVLLWRADGSNFPAHITASPLNHTGILCVTVTDLTLQKQAEEDRNQLLRERIARAEAEQAMHMLREADLRRGLERKEPDGA